MKKYLNKTERTNILYLLNLIDRAEFIVMDWDSRGNLTKAERKNLKTALTFAVKGVESIICRQDRTVIQTLSKEKERSAIHIDLRHSLEIIMKRKSAELNKAYEENKEYYRLVELILEKNCKGCKIQCGECEFFKEFEEQCVPYMDGDEKYQNCKYSY